MASDEMRVQYPAIAAAIQRVDGLLISTDMARLIMHGLSGYATLAAQRNGCAPDWVAKVQYALAEPLAESLRQREPLTCESSRQREVLSSAEAEILPFGYDEITTAEAAATLGISPDAVRWHCRKGNLESRKVGRQLMVTTTSIENYKQRKARRSA
jgi:DNA-binding CsgD family transcriptional regulator